MTDPVFGVDEMRTEQEIQRWAAAAAAKAEKYQAVAQQVATVHITEVSRDGIVRVTVDATGALVNLEIAEQHREVAGAALAATVLATMRKAQARIAGRVSEIVAEVGVEDKGTASALVSSYQQRFPEPEPETPPWAAQVRPSAPQPHQPAPPPPPQQPLRRPVEPPQQPARRRVDDDEDWEGPSVTE